MMKRDCLTCVHKSKRHTEDPCFDCMPIEPYYFEWEPDKPQTNADYLRSMADEELAGLLYEADSREGSSGLDSWFEWLQQPYKENEDG